MSVEGEGEMLPGAGMVGGDGIIPIRSSARSPTAGPPGILGARGAEGEPDPVFFGVENALAHDVISPLLHPGFDGEGFVFVKGNIGGGDAAGSAVEVESGR